MGRWFKVEPFSVICGVVHVAKGNCGVPLLVKVLQ